MLNQNASDTQKSILFSTTPIVEESVAPVIVVGLPRSGSTYLAHVLSCFDDLFVYDDLYAYQIAKSLNLSGDLSQQQRVDFLHKLSWSAKAKVKWKKRIYAFTPDFDWDDIDRLEAAVLQTFEGHSLTWIQLLEEWMTRLALFQGKKRWGYKTPQDFQNMKQLSHLFPGCQFFYVMRDPKKVMASLKNLPSAKEKVKGQDGRLEQYHPFFYALYWKMAYEAVKNFQTSHPEVDVFTVKFEQLISQPDEEAKKIAELLDSNVSKSVKVEYANSSFGKRKAVKLTDTEKWLCDTLTGKYVQEAGYELSDVGPNLSDVPDLLSTTFRFTRHQARRIISEGKARHSIASYVKQLFKTT